MPEPRQVVRGGKSARSGADDEHAFSRRLRRRLELPSLLASGVAEKPLHRVNRDRAVEMCAVANRLAGAVADPAVDGGKRIVGDQLTPGLFVAASSDVGKPCLNVLPRRARGIARRQQIDIYRTAVAVRACAGPATQQVRQSRHVAARSGTKYLAATPRPLGRHLSQAMTAPGGFEASFVL
jgi:hypothetical protein